MKRLTKIKLLNWHLFSDQTIEINDNTLISGENGSGKSTLLDALQYILVGGRSGVKFNIAATDEAKRTLEGYIRGRIGAENKEFIRNGDVVSHVALEFYDDQNEEYGVLGVILELPKLGNLKERFYLLRDINIHDDMFMDKKTPRDYKSMKAYLKTLNIDLEPFNTQKDYRDAMAKYFGIDAKKYAKILPKALAFRPIDLQSFVFEFLLDDEPIDIQSLKNNVEQLKRVEQQIQLDKEKVEKLEKIVKLGENLNQNLDQLKINELIEKMSFIEKRESIIRNSENLLDKVNQKYEALKVKKEEIDRLIEENDDQILELESLRSHNDLAKTLYNLQEQLEKKVKAYEEYRELLNELKEQLTKEANLLKTFTQYYPNTHIDAFVKYYLTHSDHKVEELNEYMNGAKNALEGIQTALTIEKVNIEKERDEALKNLNIAKQRLNALKRNIKTYPRHVTLLIEKLNEELSNYYKKDIRVRPFCELIEVEDEQWRNALEGYLGGQRFDIIVEPLYFNDALEVYDRVKVELGIYGVGLVNTNKITEYTNYLPNSLAAKVKTEHPYARYYANMLMGHVITVENLADLKNYARSITKTCMTYSNHTARQINPKTYEVPYIGQNATNIQIELDQKLVDELESNLSEVSKRFEKANDSLRLIHQSKISQLVQTNQTRFIELTKQTRKEMIELEEKVQKLTSNPELNNINKNLEDERTKKRQLKIEHEDIVSKMADLRSEKTRILESIEDARDSLRSHLEEQKTWNETYPELIQSAYSQFNALKQKFANNYDLIARDIAESTTKIQAQNTRAELEVINLMKAYIVQYHFGAAPDISELIHFEREMNLIKDNNLMQYEQQAIELRRRSEIGFREEFVGKLRASIEAAQIQIQELNMALEGKKFGTDTYQLVTKPSENPEFKTYYDIIMGSDAVYNHTLFTENLSKKHEVVLMELFNKIASFDPENDKFALQFLDYRYYMSYDIEVTSENGNKSFFSKVSREKSGGETQVPFYIVIAASFQQLLTKNKRVDSGCIVLFDEAFNNMDESRIDAMMKFYNSLSIQLFIAVPPQRVSNIINYVTTSLAIVKDNDFAIVESFTREVM